MGAAALVMVLVSTSPFLVGGGRGALHVKQSCGRLQATAPGLRRSKKARALPSTATTTAAVACSSFPHPAVSLAHQKGVRALGNCDRACCPHHNCSPLTSPAAGREQARHQPEGSLGRGQGGGLITPLFLGDCSGVCPPGPLALALSGASGGINPVLPSYLWLSSRCGLLATCPRHRTSSSSGGWSRQTLLQSSSPRAERGITPLPAPA